MAGVNDILTDWQSGDVSTDIIASRLSNLNWNWMTARDRETYKTLIRRMMVASVDRQDYDQLFPAILTASKAPADLIKAFDEVQAAIKDSATAQAEEPVSTTIETSAGSTITIPPIVTPDPDPDPLPSIEPALEPEPEPILPDPPPPALEPEPEPTFTYDPNTDYVAQGAQALHQQWAEAIAMGDFATAAQLSQQFSSTFPGYSIETGLPTPEAEPTQVEGAGMSDFETVEPVQATDADGNLRYSLDGRPIYVNDQGSYTYADGSSVEAYNINPMTQETYSDWKAGYNDFDPASYFGTPQLDENGQPVLDADGNPIYDKASWLTVDPSTVGYTPQTTEQLITNMGDIRADDTTDAEGNIIPGRSMKDMLMAEFDLDNPDFETFATKATTPFANASLASSNFRNEDALAELMNKYNMTGEGALSSTAAAKAVSGQVARAGAEHDLGVANLYSGAYQNAAQLDYNDVANQRATGVAVLDQMMTNEGLQLEKATQDAILEQDAAKTSSALQLEAQTAIMQGDLNKLSQLLTVISVLGEQQWMFNETGTGWEEFMGGANDVGSFIGNIGKLILGLGSLD